MADPRILKKYPNRRLYDLAAHRYITLFDVQALVWTRVPFVVREHDSNEDRTDEILMKVILECSPKTLGRQYLLQMIRRQM